MRFITFLGSMPQKCIGWQGSAPSPTGGAYSTALDLLARLKGGGTSRWRKERRKLEGGKYLWWEWQKAQSQLLVLRVIVGCLVVMSDEMCWSAVNSQVSTAESPAGRHSHSAVVYQHRMWVYGGLSGLTALNDLWTWYFGKYSAHVYLQFHCHYFINSWTSALAARAHAAENFTTGREWWRLVIACPHREWVIQSSINQFLCCPKIQCILAYIIGVCGNVLSAFWSVVCHVGSCRMWSLIWSLLLFCWFQRWWYFSK